MIELTREQRQEYDGGESIVVDPHTREEFVLVPKSVYEKLQSLQDDDGRDMYPLLADLDPEDWEDAANYETKP